MMLYPPMSELAAKVSKACGDEVEVLSFDRFAFGEQN